MPHEHCRAIMMRLLSLFLLGSIGCVLPEENDPEDHTLTIQVDASGVGAPSWVSMFGGDTPITVGGELPTAPITPAMLAANLPPPSNVTIVGGGLIPLGSGWPSGKTEATFTLDGSIELAYGAVIGQRYADGQPMYTVAELPRDVTTAQGDAYLDVALAAVPDAEVWGNGCLRLETATATHYVVRLGDYDCDGLYGADDCKPTTYCDKNATSGPAYEACLCD
jgi:hypothetical protein